MGSPILSTGANRPAGVIVAQRDARSNRWDVTAVSAMKWLRREAVGWAERESGALGGGTESSICS